MSDAPALSFRSQLVGTDNRYACVLFTYGSSVSVALVLPSAVAACTGAPVGCRVGGCGCSTQADALYSQPFPPCNYNFVAPGFIDIMLAAPAAQSSARRPIIICSDERNGAAAQELAWSAAALQPAGVPRSGSWN
jgi:hypothetical protein